MCAISIEDGRGFAQLDSGACSAFHTGSSSYAARLEYSCRIAGHEFVNPAGYPLTEIRKRGQRFGETLIALKLTPCCGTLLVSKPADR
jgi:hypothetical protein